jgi:hypothetical protein
MLTVRDLHVRFNVRNVCEFPIGGIRFFAVLRMTKGA